METIHPTHFFKAKWKWLKTSLKIDRVDPTRYSLVYILVAFVSHSFYCRDSLLASLFVACWIEVWGWRPGGNVVVVGLIGFYPCWKHKRLVVWTWSNKSCMSYSAYCKRFTVEVRGGKERSSQRGFIFVSLFKSRFKTSGHTFIPQTRFLHKWMEFTNLVWLFMLIEASVRANR